MTLKVPDAEFIAAWNQTGGRAAEVSRILNLSERGVMARRRNMERKLGHALLSASPKSPDQHIHHPPGRVAIDIPDGIVIIGSDAHIWPGFLTTAQRAFIAFAGMLKPSAVVLNGDLVDGARNSMHPHGIWKHEQRPTVKQELEACQAFMDALYAAHRPAKHLWTWGNHDARFEAKLAASVPEYEGVAGFALKDHFPEWKLCMSAWINDAVIKHRWHGGIHATFQNAQKSGKSLITGHLHSLRVTPWTDYTGTRYGVDTGCLADPDGFMFDYTEDNPKNWRSGFAVLTFKGGKLLLPELVQVWDGDHVQFRGELIAV